MSLGRRRVPSASSPIARDVYSALSPGLPLYHIADTRAQERTQRFSRFAVHSKNPLHATFSASLSSNGTHTAHREILIQHSRPTRAQTCLSQQTMVLLPEHAQVSAEVVAQRAFFMAPMRLVELSVQQASRVRYALDYRARCCEKGRRESMNTRVQGGGRKHRSRPSRG